MISALIEKTMHKLGEPFQKGKPFERLYPLFEAGDTFLLSPNLRTQRAPHVRDAIDLKRLMSIVIIALVPALIMGIYNTGYQILHATNQQLTLLACLIAGAIKVLPIVFTSYAVGGACEALFSIVRKHEINEGFLVTGMLFPLSLPPTVPLWQAALGISFGVIIGKEIFGGTGMNILNPALTARVFLFFSYPAFMSGDGPWTAVDGYAHPTPLSTVSAATSGHHAVDALADAGYTVSNMFWGLIPGSIGETSTFACLLGLAILVLTGVGSWRIITGCFIGGVVTASILLLFENTGNPMYSIPPLYHLIMGSFAFGAVFMSTDPVSAAATNAGRWLYGLLIGFLIIVIRTINPAYPEGVMLAILFMNVFAPLIDYFVVKGNINRRLRRA